MYYMYVPMYSMYACKQNKFPEMDNKIELNWIELIELNWIDLTAHPISVLDEWILFNFRIFISGLTSLISFSDYRA